MQEAHKKPCDLDFSSVTLIFNRLLDVVQVHDHANFIGQSAAVYELSCAQCFNDAETILPSLPRAVKEERSKSFGARRHRCGILERREVVWGPRDTVGQ